MGYFPLFIELERQKILVAGGGKIAERRIEALLPSGCRILVVSPWVTGNLRQKGGEGEIEILLTDFDTFLISSRAKEKFRMVLAATDSPEVNRRVADFGRREGACVNRADCREDSDFYFPGIVRKGPLVIGVTASGKDHRLAKQVTDSLRKMIDREY